MADFKSIVRIVNTDIDGSKKLYPGLTKIKGINFMFSNAICNVLNIDKNIKLGDLGEANIKKIETLLKEPNSKLPSWMLNRRKDYETGDDLHFLSSNVNLNKEFDIKRLKKIKSRKGLRHAANLPLRGQRTKSHFRKGKSVGVSKKVVKSKKA